MKIKFISILMCLFMVTFVFAGCGAKSEQAISEETQIDEQQTNADDTKKDSEDLENKSKENKKIVYVLEADIDIRMNEKKESLSALEKAGYVKDKNAEIIELSLQNDEKKGPEIVNKIKELKPDIVIIGSGVIINKVVTKPLMGSGIPVVIATEIESADGGFIDEQGKPKDNVTGLYTMPLDMQLNAFKLLQRISSPNGKKAVFITVPGFFTKEAVEKNLKAVGVELKEYCESKYFEDQQAALKKYNDDNDVAWILLGVGATVKKDGSNISVVDSVAKFIADSKKPSVTYWEAAVSLGILCGLGVDITECGAQIGEMAAKILNGEKVENVKAQSPRKINIVLNQKNAEQLKVQFPSDILGSASKIFIDYEGHTK